jgi:hypothetical protein
MERGRYSFAETTLDSNGTGIITAHHRRCELVEEATRAPRSVEAAAEHRRS